MTDKHIKMIEEFKSDDNLKDNMLSYMYDYLGEQKNTYPVE